MKFSDDTSLSETRQRSSESISGYRLETLIDSNQRGEVYRAVQIESGISCLITIRKADEESSGHFLRDAELAATLFNPGVADVYESGSLDNGNVFVVAEDIDGRSLRELMDSDGVPRLLDTVEIIRQAAEALHDLHVKGLTHRAIRPENIFLTKENDQMLVRLQHLDLGGLAEHLTVGNKFQIETALDSLRYFAPEQSSGERATQRTDIYSLGIVFYEMLTGEPPFDASKATALIGLHRNQPPPEVRIDNFDLRMLVTHALMETLQKRPDARQSTADLLARQLRHIEQLSTHNSTPASILDTTPTSTKPLPRKVFVAPDIDILAGIVENNHAPVPEPTVLYREPEPTYIEPPMVERPVFLLNATESVVTKRTKIECQPLDEDIPTLEEVMETVANEQEYAVGLEKLPEEGEAVVQNVTVANPTGWRPYEPAVVMEVVAAVVEAPVVSEPIIETQGFEPDSDEEITVVTAPRRIKIEWEKPVPLSPAFQSYEIFSPQRPSQIDFYPTLLGGAEKVAALETRENVGMFSSFNVPKRRLSISRRSMAVGGGLLLVIGLFFFGSGTDGSSAHDESVSAASKAEYIPVPNDKQSVDSKVPFVETPIETRQSLKLNSEPVVKEKDDAKPKSVSIKTGVNIPAEKPKISVQTRTKAPLVPTTLVISAEKGNVKMKTEPTKNTAGTTRPRIVKEP